MSVADRWHKSRPKPDEKRCSEHRKVPTADHGEGDRWQVRWRDESGQQRARNFAKLEGNDPEQDAKAFDAKIRSQLDAGTSIDLAAAKMKVRDYAVRHRAGLLHRDSTAERMERVFRLHVDPLPLGNMTMGQLLPPGTPVKYLDKVSRGIKEAARGQDDRDRLRCRPRAGRPVVGNVKDDGYRK